MKKEHDVILFLSYIIILVFGLTILYSVTWGRRFSYLFYRQLFWDILSVGVFFLFSRIKRKFWEDNAVYLLLLSFGLLVVVLLTPPVAGANRWLDLGIASFQPSELAKLSIVMFLAWLYTKDQTLKIGIIGFFTTIAASFLVFIEPDFGTALMLFALWFVITFVSAKFDRLLIASFIIIIAVSPFVLFFGLKEYQLKRILSFLNPAAYSREAAYNTIQAMRAIGSGGFSGKGFLQGDMSRYGFVPENHTDFIFSAVGEQFGFLGSVLLIALYTVLIWRIWKTAKNAHSEFMALVSTGFLTIILFHIIENIGMNLGLFPVTGIPLPFISYGGSSALFFSAQLGMIYGASEKTAKT